MDTTTLLASIDAEITRLQSARDLLSNSTPAASKRGPGRPKGSGKSASKAATKKTTGKRTLIAAGLTNIATAQKARRAAEKKGNRRRRLPS